MQNIAIVKVIKCKCIRINGNSHVYQNVGIDTSGNVWTFYYDVKYLINGSAMLGYNYGFVQGDNTKE